MCPCRTVRSEPRTDGESPAQDASLRAEANRVMSPVSATMTSAANLRSRAAGRRDANCYSSCVLGGQPSMMVSSTVRYLAALNSI
jgi:hypothetical protein